MGDDGTTQLYGGQVVSKTDSRIEVCGTLDEASAVLGLARSFGLDPWSDEVAESIQRDLLRLGAEVACPKAEQRRRSLTVLAASDVECLERAIDQAEERLDKLSAFVLSGGSKFGGSTAASALHVVRTVVRRAERRLVALSAVEGVRGELLAYINRASDLLFMLGRIAEDS